MITTHVLDTSAGRPGRGLAVELERADGAGAGWTAVARGTTDDDGRCRTLTQPGPLPTGTYKLRFHTPSPFFPVVEIQFVVADGAQHYHVPLLLAPYGYSTYRGS
jgi:5-hydroxyisourate hydrolase